MPSLAAAMAGYLVVMGPWAVRNIAVAGSPLAPGGSQALWFTSYNELFDYPARHTQATYLAAGWRAILAGKCQAISLNLQTAVAVHGWIVLAPFIVVGLWGLRSHPVFRPGILYALMLYFFMTFAFTFPGPRGGLFHSGAALVPFFAAAGPIGLARAVKWVARRRPGWREVEATRVFLIGFGAIAAIVTLGLFAVRVVGADPARPAWSAGDEVHASIGAWLAKEGDPGSVVVVNNPPGFYYHTGLPAVVVPNGGPDTLLAVSERYGAHWAVLDINVPDDLQDFYARHISHDRLQLAQEFHDGQGRQVYLYRVLP
jgi:hypothetical protein